MKKFIWWFIIFLVFVLLASPAYHNKYKFTKIETSKIKQYKPGDCYVYKSTKNTDSILIFKNDISEPQNTFGFDYEGVPFYQFNVGDRVAESIILGLLKHENVSYSFWLSLTKYSNFKPFEFYIWYGNNFCLFNVKNKKGIIELKPVSFSQRNNWISEDSIDRNSKSPILKFDYILLDKNWIMTEYKIDGEDDIYRLSDIINVAI